MLNGAPQSLARSIAGMLAVVAFASGCSSPEPLPSGAPPVFAAVLRDAENGGASERQLDIIRSAAETGTVGYEDVVDALGATFDCFDANGVGHVSEGVSILQSGLPFPNYGWGGGVSEEEVTRLTALGDECLQKNSYFVELLYQTQPSAVEGENVAFEERRSDVVACLNKVGVEVGSDATRSEIEQAAATVLQDLGTGVASPDPQTQAVIDCLAPPS